MGDKFNLLETFGTATKQIKSTSNLEHTLLRFIVLILAQF